MEPMGSGDLPPILDPSVPSFFLEA
jgi:hypothetical protein